MDWLFLIFTGSWMAVTGCSEADPGGPEQELPFVAVTATHLQSGGLAGNSMDGHAVDIDNDGDMDMVIAREFQPNTLLINDGTGVLSDESATRFPRIARDSEDIAVADFDGDGDLDIIFVSEDDQLNEYYRNQGDATFEDISSQFPVSGTTNAVEVWDFNGDTSPDLLLGNGGQNFLLINDGRGQFMDETATRLPVNTFVTQDVELADVDGDGDLDIVEANEEQNRLLINDGNGFFTDQTAARLPQVVDQTREADFGDMDNDGDLDLFFANVDFGGFGDPQNRLLLNSGAGVFTEATDRLPVSSYRTVDADLIDINGDGFLDILSGNRANGPDQLVLINDGAAKFTDQTTAFFPSISAYTFDYQAADFNRDGITDLYLCNFRGEDELLFGQSTTASGG